jgi:ribosomal protein L37AE/L43A
VGRVEKQNVHVGRIAVPRLCPRDKSQLEVHRESEIVFKCPVCGYTERSAASGISNPDFERETWAQE